MGGRIGATSRGDVCSIFWTELPNDVPPNSERLAGARVRMAEDNVVITMIAGETLEQ